MSLARILICRSDAIGDALLALPVVTALRRAFPQTHLGFLASDYAADAVDLQAHGPDAVLRYDARGRHAGRAGLRTLAREIAEHGFDAALMVYPDRRISWAVYCAGIRLRVGTGRRWWSLLFNRRIRKSRSQGGRHEAEYNLDLVRALGVAAELEAPLLKTCPGDQAWADAYLKGKGIELRRPWVILHPGGRGSADNWPAKNYGRLARLACDSGVQVFLTGTACEQPLLHAVTAASGLPALPRLIEPVTLKQLAAVIARAGALVSGSTGPMHLAAGLRVPTVSLFPEGGVTGPERWRPLSPLARVLTPGPGEGVGTIAPETVAQQLREVLAAKD